MKNKLRIGTIRLGAAQGAPSQLARDPDRACRRQEEKASLVFLASLMQIENSILTELPDNKQSKREKKSSLGNTLLTSQDIAIKPHRSAFDKHSYYFKSKRKKAEGEERSISNLIGEVKM